MDKQVVVPVAMKLLDHACLRRSIRHLLGALSSSTWGVPYILLLDWGEPTTAGMSKRLPIDDSPTCRRPGAGPAR
jgi:hypothetical protein